MPFHGCFKKAPWTEINANQRHNDNEYLNKVHFIKILPWTLQIQFKKSHQSILTLNQNSLSGSSNNIYIFWAHPKYVLMNWWKILLYTASIESWKNTWKIHENHNYEMLLTFTTPKPDYNSKDFLMWSNAFLVIVNLTIYFTFQLSSTSCRFCCYTFT